MGSKDQQDVVEPTCLTTGELDADLAALQSAQRAVLDALSPLQERARELGERISELWESRAVLSQGDLTWILQHTGHAPTAHRRAEEWIRSLTPEFLRLGWYPTDAGVSLGVEIALVKDQDVSHLPGVLESAWAEFDKAFPQVGGDITVRRVGVLERHLSAAGSYSIVVEGESAQLVRSWGEELSGTLLEVLAYVAREVWYRSGDPEECELSAW